MKVLLFPLNIAIDQSGSKVSEESAREAVKWTQFPLMGWITKYEEVFPGIENAMKDNALEIKCVSMTVEPDGIYGEVEVLSKQSRLLTHPEEYRFFGRVMPRPYEGTDMRFIIQNGVFGNFYFSSVGFEPK